MAKYYYDVYNTKYSKGGTKNFGIFVESPPPEAYYFYEFDENIGFTVDSGPQDIDNLSTGRWYYSLDYDGSLFSYYLLSTEGINKAEFTKKRTQLEKVKSTFNRTITANDGQYPNNGLYGNYWYIKKDPVIINVSEVSLDKNEITVENKNPIQLKVNITPSNATNKNIFWSSEDESVATVDQNGLITPIKNGIVNIYATSEDGGLTDFCKLNVEIYKSIFLDNNNYKKFDLSTKQWLTIKPSEKTFNSGLTDLKNLIQNTTKSKKSTGGISLSSGKKFNHPVNLKAFKKIDSISIL